MSLLSVLLFTGCSESNTQPESDPYQIESTISGFEPYVEDTSNYKIISYAVSTAPKTIDPKYVVASSMDAEYIYHTSEGLLRMYDGIVCPGIANTWEKVGNKFALLKKRIEEEIVPGKTFDHQLAQMKKSNVKES